MGLAPAANARAALGQHDQATALLTEIVATPDLEYTYDIAGLVRTALTTNNPKLAHQLTTGVEPHTPFEEHALVSATAALAEAHGNHQQSADGYAEAARRWEAFGVIPEQAFALLGHGRCLLALGRTNKATPTLMQAREIFARLQAAPALVETDQLLQQAAALSA
jgi:tetratricopeptide (TPR) repeat protein